MKLYKYDFLELPGRTIQSGQPAAAAFVYAEAQPANYTVFNTIENINSYGFGVDGFDYKRVRDLIKIEVETIGFNNLTANEKIICAIHKIGTPAERLAAVGGDVSQLIIYGDEYGRKLLGVRKERIIRAKTEVRVRLDAVQVGSYTAPEVVLNEITENVIIMFENEGLGGVYDGDNLPGLMDYFNETPGTPYENNGLKSKTWTPEGLTDCTQLANIILDILQKGIY